MRLSPIDHIYVGPSSLPIDLVFRYESRQEPAPLREALRQVLEDFHPMRSELVRLDRGSYGLRPLPEDTVFLETKDVPALPDFDDMRALGATGARAGTVPGQRLFTATLLSDDKSSYLVISASHAATDGFGLFSFLGAWGSTARGTGYRKPSHDRHLLTPSLEASEPRVTPESFFRDTGYNWAGQRPGPNEARCNFEIVRWTREEQSTLLKETRAEAGVTLSENDVLVAWLWKKYATLWHRDKPRVRLSNAVDYRRFYPGLSAATFGNAVCGTFLDMPFEELAESSVATIARQIRASVDAIDLPYVYRFLRTLEAVRLQEGADVIEHLDPSPPEHGFFVSNFSRFPMPALDFGGGAPVAVRALLPLPRAVIVLPQTGGPWEMQVQAPI